MSCAAAESAAWNSCMGTTTASVSSHTLPASAAALPVCLPPVGSRRRWPAAIAAAAATPSETRRSCCCCSRSWNDATGARGG
jgi:hypothetical protein